MCKHAFVKIQRSMTPAHSSVPFIAFRLVALLFIIVCCLWRWNGRDEREAFHYMQSEESLINYTVERAWFHAYHRNDMCTFVSLNFRCWCKIECRNTCTRNCIVPLGMETKYLWRRLKGISIFKWLIQAHFQHIQYLMVEYCALVGSHWKHGFSFHSWTDWAL